MLKKRECVQQRQKLDYLLSQYLISRDQNFRWKFLDINYLPLNNTLFSISSSSNLRYSTEVESVIFVAIIFSSVQEGSWWLNFRPWFRVIYERVLKTVHVRLTKLFPLEARFSKTVSLFQPLHLFNFYNVGHVWFPFRKYFLEKIMYKNKCNS